MTSTALHPVHVARGHLARLVVLAVLALAAGCGGSEGEQQQAEPEPTAAEAWADEVCSTVTTWQAAVAHSRAMLKDAANLSANDARHALTFAADATRTFIADLKDTGAPDTEAGQAAAEQLSTLSDQLQEQAEVVARAAESSNTLPEMLDSVSAVSQAFSTMVTDTTTAVENIRGLDGAAELESAFADSTTCQQLRGTG
ncbi:hypothetical protein [Nocardioides sp.]|uniref:hypothetical protein n=1 Tax=Nocardioides sp. TaxID=35761 RepID=UPI002D7EF178|nr:hypothetical protein [Nocardioides sp.]HET8959475.1 hypothetical protein [Nocardioides sp.]